MSCACIFLKDVLLHALTRAIPWINDHSHGNMSHHAKPKEPEIFSQPLSQNASSAKSANESLEIPRYVLSQHYPHNLIEEQEAHRHW